MTLAVREHHRRASGNALCLASGVYQTRRTVVPIPKYAMVMTAATAAAKTMTAAAVSETTSDKSQARGPIARTVAPELRKTMSMR